jgi:uncharacterized membrane protein YoaT (DUF817 family)
MSLAKVPIDAAFTIGGISNYVVGIMGKVAPNLMTATSQWRSKQQTTAREMLQASKIGNRFLRLTLVVLQGTINS